MIYCWVDIKKAKECACNAYWQKCWKLLLYVARIIHDTMGDVKTNRTSAYTEYGIKKETVGVMSDAVAAIDPFDKVDKRTTTLQVGARGNDRLCRYRLLT